MKGYYNKGKRQRVKMDTVEDRIMAYMLNLVDDDQLSQDDKNILIRLNGIWALLCAGCSPHQAVKMHVNQQEITSDAISMRTAYEDLRRATDLWGKVEQTSQRARYLLLFEMSMETYNLSKGNKDFNQMNRSLKNLVVINDKLVDTVPENEAPAFIMTFGRGDERVNMDLEDFVKADQKRLDALIQLSDPEDLSDEALDKLLSDGLGS